MENRYPGQFIQWNCASMSKGIVHRDDVLKITVEISIKRLNDGGFQAVIRDI